MTQPERRAVRRSNSPSPVIHVDRDGNDPGVDVSSQEALLQRVEIVDDVTFDRMAY
jgi:hypothetical protein